MAEAWSRDAEERLRVGELGNRAYDPAAAAVLTERLLTFLNDANPHDRGGTTPK